MKDKLSEAELNKKEAEIKARLSKLEKKEAALEVKEREIREREREVRTKDAKRKQVILRLPESLWQDIARWAEDDFRSINGQIEYILTRASKEFRK